MTSDIAVNGTIASGSTDDMVPFIAISVVI
jgi:hypothetical protein